MTHINREGSLRPLWGRIDREAVRWGKCSPARLLALTRKSAEGMERVAERRTPSGGIGRLTVSTKPDAPRDRYPQGRGARAFSALHPTRLVPSWICAPPEAGVSRDKDRSEPHDGRGLPARRPR